MYLINLSQDRSNINNYISTTLFKKIKETLEKNKKIILYLNKRGDFSSLICSNCSHLYKCNNCDNSLSVHKYPEKLICHICNDSKNIPSKCEKCNKETLNKVGIGTQQLETILKEQFKDKKIFRFDTDVVKNKSEKENALDNISGSDIIIGTKMITTGFNFKNVGLIGVILIEQELQIPKYNTEEKVYSNIKQLIGRGNRNGEVTDIAIQTFIPENDFIKSITKLNYKEFFIKTLEERKLFNYPPYCELVNIEYRNKDKEKALSFINKIKEKLNQNNKNNDIEIISIPNANKKHNQFYYKLILKGNKLREFIECIKTDIMRNSGLVVIFE